MNKKGFTLIELLIVVAIIGILAAIAIPNLLAAVQRAKQKRTMADMRELAVAWESRQTDASRYNAAGAGYLGIDQPIDLNNLEGSLVPTYTKHMPKLDGWNNPLQCFSEIAWGGLPSSKYLIMSGGRDGVFDSSVMPGATTNFDCDIIYGNGSFVVYPEGVQQQ